MMVSNDEFASSLNNENGSTTSTRSAESDFILTTLSNAPESSIFKVAESDMRAIHQPGEPKTTTSRAGTSLAERRSTVQTPLQLDLAHTHSAFPDPHAYHERSQAIDIPIVKRNPREPTTPLTARAEKSGDFSYFQPSYGSPRRSPSLRPRYYLTPVRGDFTASSMRFDDSPPSGSSISSTPSATSTASATSAVSFQPASIDSIRLHRQRLHPVGRSTSSPATHLGIMDPGTPTKAKSPSLGRVIRSPQPHQRQVSDAQKQLQQYQRDLIANATRAPASLAAGGRLEKPDTPHLRACGSPGTGPATPLMLEEPGDYLSAGIARSADYRSDGLTSSVPGVAGGLTRELVDQLLRREETRRVSGLSPQGGSPAVSPAGGPG